MYSHLCKAGCEISSYSMYLYLIPGRIQCHGSMKEKASYLPFNCRGVRQGGYWYLSYTSLYKAAGDRTPGTLPLSYRGFEKLIILGGLS